MGSNVINHNLYHSQNENVLENYSAEILKLKEYARQNDISDQEIEELFYNAFHSISSISRIHQLLKKIVTISFIVLIVYTGTYYYNSTSSFMVRNMQTWIYPGFKMWRKITIPVIKTFPSLTEFYDESCLIENPFYQILDKDCTYCKNVKFIPDLTYVNKQIILEYQLPYTVQTSQPIVSLQDLHYFYSQNKQVFDENAPTIYSNNNSINSLDLMMNTLTKKLSSDTKFLWRINRMVAGRLLRIIIQRPNVITNLGQSVERFIMILGPDVSQSEFPKTDCFNVFLLQLFGSRNIVLKPFRSCALCKTISVHLKSTYVLVYNRLQFKAISFLEKNNNSESITFIGSYC